MRNRRDPHAGWMGRFIRGHRFDGNPLRRRSDRAETVILACEWRLRQPADFLRISPCCDAERPATLIDAVAVVTVDSHGATAAQTPEKPKAATVGGPRT